MLGWCIAQFRITMSYVKMNIVEVEVAVQSEWQRSDDYHGLELQNRTWVTYMMIKSMKH